MSRYTPHPRAAELDLLSRSIRRLTMILSPALDWPLSGGTEANAVTAVQIGEAWLRETPDEALTTAAEKLLRLFIEEEVDDLRDVLREAGLLREPSDEEVVALADEAELELIPLESRAPATAARLHERLTRARQAGDVAGIESVIDDARRRLGAIRARDEGVLAVGGAA